jgi:hypothetical protein
LSEFKWRSAPTAQGCRELSWPDYVKHFYETGDDFIFCESAALRCEGVYRRFGRRFFEGSPGGAPCSRQGKRDFGRDSCAEPQGAEKLNQNSFWILIQAKDRSNRKLHGAEAPSFPE